MGSEFVPNEPLQSYLIDEGRPGRRVADAGQVRENHAVPWVHRLVQILVRMVILFCLALLLGEQAVTLTAIVGIQCAISPEPALISQGSWVQSCGISEGKKESRTVFFLPKFSETSSSNPATVLRLRVKSGLWFQRQ